MNLQIPSLTARNQNFDLYLPASANHPNAAEPFRRAANVDFPQYTDLGMWNIYQNPDAPNPQSVLHDLVCGNGQDCSVDQGLGRTIATFKTPTLRDLEDSSPYFHNGGKLQLDDVVQFYVFTSQQSRQGLLRNPPPEFQGMSISADDVEALKAFLLALTEDYDDA